MWVAGSGLPTGSRPGSRPLNLNRHPHLLRTLLPASPSTFDLLILTLSSPASFVTISPPSSRPAKCRCLSAKSSFVPDTFTPSRWFSIVRISLACFVSTILNRGYCHPWLCLSRPSSSPCVTPSTTFYILSPANRLISDVNRVASPPTPSNFECLHRL